jgi:hypothetical protein
MDWRFKKYYTASFYFNSLDYRIEILKQIPSIKIHTFKKMLEIQDEANSRGLYQILISCDFDKCEIVEYELRKAERNNPWCNWQEIKRDLSKKYFDVCGNVMPYRRCDLNPRKRCNHCMGC